MADVLRQGGSYADDRPVSLLGHHHITVRYIAPTPAPSASSTTPAAPAAAAATVAPARHVAGSSLSDSGAPPAGPRVHVQELASFDARDGPKALLPPGGESNPLLTLPAAESSFATFVGPAHVGGGQQQLQTSGGAAERQWVPGPQPLAIGPRRLAIAHFRVQPDVAVKAKRLGRDVKVKVRLEGGGEVVMLPPPPSTPSGTYTLAAAAGVPALASPAACSPGVRSADAHGCTGRSRACWSGGGPPCQHTAARCVRRQRQKIRQRSRRPVVSRECNQYGGDGGWRYGSAAARRAGQLLWQPAGGHPDRWCAQRWLAGAGGGSLPDPDRGAAGRHRQGS